MSNAYKYREYLYIRVFNYFILTVSILRNLRVQKHKKHHWEFRRCLFSGYLKKLVMVLVRLFSTEEYHICAYYIERFIYEQQIFLKDGNYIVWLYNNCLKNWSENFLSVPFYSKIIVFIRTYFFICTTSKWKTLHRPWSLENFLNADKINLNIQAMTWNLM